MSAAKLHLVEEKVVSAPKSKAKKPRAKALARPSAEVIGSSKSVAATEKPIRASPKTTKREALAGDVMSSPALA
jgi:hypothetical protein